MHRLEQSGETKQNITCLTKQEIPITKIGRVWQKCENKTEKRTQKSKKKIRMFQRARINITNVKNTLLGKKKPNHIRDFIRLLLDIGAPGLAMYRLPHVQSAILFAPVLLSVLRYNIKYVHKTSKCNVSEAVMPVTSEIENWAKFWTGLAWQLTA